jgi:acyl carrier protein
LSEAEAAAIWKRVKQIVIEQLGADPEAVTPTASFVEDLRLD